MVHGAERRSRCCEPVPLDELEAPPRPRPARPGAGASSTPSVRTTSSSATPARSRRPTSPICTTASSGKHRGLTLGSSSSSRVGQSPNGRFLEGASSPRAAPLDLRAAAANSLAPYTRFRRDLRVIAQAPPGSARLKTLQPISPAQTYPCFHGSERTDTSNRGFRDGLQPARSGSAASRLCDRSSSTSGAHSCPNSAHYIFRAFRQVLAYAVDMNLIDRSRIRNTRAATRNEQRPFASWKEIEAIAAEMDPRYAAIPIVLAGTGLRPEEFFQLERRNVDLDAAPCIERVYTQRVLKEPKKSSRQRRRVPLRARVVDALRTLPPRLDTPLLFLLPAAATSTTTSGAGASGHPRRAPGGRIEHRRIYDCRHTFASSR